MSHKSSPRPYPWPMLDVFQPAPRAKLPDTITFDQWAESGGTAGIFAKGVKSGTIKIIDEEA
jgi:hypothetical protein